MLSDEKIICKLCGDEIVERVAGEYWCFGCKAYICDNHMFGSLWGGHLPTDHDPQADAVQRD